MLTNTSKHFVKSVAVLSSGTVLAQVIAYIATPFITRLFSPEEIGELGFIMRIVAFVGAIATARYEYAIPLPKNDSHAFHLFRLSLKITFVTLVLCSIAAIIVFSLNSFDTLYLWYGILFLPLLFLSVFKNIGTYWAIRFEQFKLISKTSVLGSAATNLLKIFAGWLKLSVFGLLIATILGLLAGVVLFIRNFLRNKKLKLYQKSPVKIKLLSKKYKDFPLYNLPQMLLDQGREIGLAIAIIYFLDQFVFGSFDHSFRMLKIPLALVGVAIGQVFYTKAAQLTKSNHKITPFLIKTMMTLFFVATIPFLVIYFYGENIFVFVFGENWALSGKISALLAPWLLLNFVTSPVSGMPLILNKQKYFFIISVFTSLLHLAVFVIATYAIQKEILSFNDGFLLISIVMSFLTVVYALFLVKQSLKHDNTIEV